MAGDKIIIGVQAWNHEWKEACEPCVISHQPRKGFTTLPATGFPQHNQTYSHLQFTIFFTPEKNNVSNVAIVTSWDHAPRAHQHDNRYQPHIWPDRIWTVFGCYGLMAKRAEEHIRSTIRFLLIRTVIGEHWLSNAASALRPGPGPSPQEWESGDLGNY